MGIKGDNSRERILSVAEQIMLKKGFSSTSTNEIIDKACITKSGFFYHFKGKGEQESMGSDTVLKSKPELD